MMKSVNEAEVLPRRLLISAFGIHMGGGLVLLRALLQAAQNFTKEILLDARLKSELHVDASINIYFVPKSFIFRIFTQSRTALRAKTGDIFLSFNSLPPLFRSRGYVINYVHAPHFIGAHIGISYTALTLIRLKIERLWFRFGIRNCDEVWVQTKSMYHSMRTQYPSLKIKIVPLVDDVIINGLAIKNIERKINDGHDLSFIYPADGVGHKNHQNLLQAWQHLENSGFRPKLLLTLEKDEFTRKISAAGLDGVNFNLIENLGRISRSEVLHRMQESTALIFPSLAETFGIPMLEAKLLGKPILASERDFVRDLCSPVQSFDPESSFSIAGAVSRYITGEAEPILQLFSADKFVETILACGK
jgi:glycosyltransferase involved in cell wall biosynthesis